MQYKYSLENGSKKHTCPKCNQKTFVRYVNNEIGGYLPIEYGRCDRENKCGYFESPKRSFVNNFESNVGYNANPIKQMIKCSDTKHLPKPMISYHPIRLVSESGQNFKENNFVQFLKSIFTTDQIQDAIQKYFIGTTIYWKGATVFWQIDDHLKVRHGKIMLYDPIRGKRLKRDNGTAYINSVRSILHLKNFNLKQCLFGLHLIDDSNSKKIAIVEGEKTAVIMSVFKPEYIWLATGSKQGFKYDMLKPIKKYNIIAFPDRSEYYDWLSKALELNDKGFKIKVSNLLEEKNCPVGYDLADVFMEKAKHLKVEEVSQKELIQVSKLIETETEKQVKKLAKKNSNILKLIDAFDLTDKNGIPIKI